jgi:hypothetical protein
MTQFCNYSLKPPQAPVLPLRVSQIMTFFMPVNYTTNSSATRDGQKDQGCPNQPSQFNTTRPGPDFFDPVRVEKRRKLRELMKADFPNGIPQPYVVINAQSRKGLHFVVFTF